MIAVFLTLRYDYYFNYRRNWFGWEIFTREINQQEICCTVLSRNPKKENEFYWDIATNEIDEKAFLDVDYIIHLAGAGIADKRWTAKGNKKLLTAEPNLLSYFLIL